MKRADRDIEKVLGPLEADVMRAIWQTGGPVTVRQLLDQVNGGRPKPLAYTTVMTVMSRLVEKDVLRRQREGRGYVYEAAVGGPAEIAVQAVMRDFGEDAVAHFVDEARANPAILGRLRRMLSEES